MVRLPAEPEAGGPVSGDLKRRLIRGGIVIAVLIVVVIGVIALLPGLSGVRSAISGAAPGWVLAGGIQLLGILGAVVFVQLVFADEPHSLTWRMGGAQQGANSILPTAGSTGVGYYTLSSIGWVGGRRNRGALAGRGTRPARPDRVHGVARARPRSSAAPPASDYPTAGAGGSVSSARTFAAFWWHFLVGEDWRLTPGPLLALLATVLLHQAGLTAWWLLPPAFALLLARSLRRATLARG